ncbi:MAG: 5-formyltetrahydrofolate cyclo-ligase [Candidatus Omnitrophica bacterium]|nr:5-formyltetrahydrofolate cyclo-ligase [Candidatus Omnitrophota bacterium]
MKEKETFRKKMKKMLKLQKQSERRKRSKVIREQLFEDKDFLASKRVMLYVSRGTGEVETGRIITKALNRGKKVVLPVTSVREKEIRPAIFKNSRQGMKKGPYGIYEPKISKVVKPVNVKDIDLVIVPGLAFDRKNNRLGHGQGYYDGFLKKLPIDTPKIGLGFRFQLLKKIPTAGHDVSLTKVITN